MAELKREYVIPLRRKTRFAPKWRRSKKAMSVLKEFIVKHMKTDNVIICPELNEKIWERGIKNPPGKVSVIALKTQISGVEKTLVNLIEVGVDKHLGMYATQEAQMTETVEDEIKSNSKSETKVDKTAEVKDVEVKEVTSKKSNVKKADKKEAKKEVKKDE